jgi:hypothetical protein
MRATWLGKSVKLIGGLLFSLLLNLPIDLYRNGRDNAVILGFAIAAPFVGVAVLEFLRHAGRLQKFLAQRSFDGMILRTFMCTTMALALPSIRQPTFARKCSTITSTFCAMLYG